MSPIAPDSAVTVATLFAGPGNAANITSSVNENVGFRFVLDRTVRTLSSNGIPDSGTVSGLLYVPDLEPKDPCNDILSAYIPANVTRHKDVSEFGYPVIGIAPWVSTECTNSILAASRHVNPEALVFFRPSVNNTDLPPPPADASWALKDGGRWRIENLYPIYAIPGPSGSTLMKELSFFSDGKANSSIYQKNRESNKYPQSGSSRLFTMIDADTLPSSSPSLWSFVLAILGTIVALSLILLVIYRLIQRKRRQNLRRRIDSGEIDIEYLALSQVKVPREIVEQMPLFTYPNMSSKTSLGKKDMETEIDEIESTSPSPSPSPEDEKNEPRGVTGLRKPKPAIINPATDDQRALSSNPYRMSHTQTTCAICLDDFVIGSSTVRELPCGHIFDPGCIDPFLTDNSSLCPLCKKSVLPAEYHNIAVTNAMVYQQDRAS